MAQRQLDTQARARRYRVDKKFLDEERRLETERRHLEDQGVDLTDPSVIDLTTDDQIIKEEENQPVEQIVEPSVPGEQTERQHQHYAVPSDNQSRDNDKRRVNTEPLPRTPVAQQTLAPRTSRQPSVRLAKQVQDQFPTVIPNPDKNGFLELQCPDPECRANCGQNGMFLKGYSGIHGHVSGHAPEVVRGLDKAQILPLCIKKKLSIRTATQMIKHPRAVASYKVERVSMKRGPECTNGPKPKRLKGSKTALHPDSEEDNDAELYVGSRTRQRKLPNSAVTALAAVDEHGQKAGNLRPCHVSGSSSTATSGPPIAKPGQMGSKKSPPSPRKDKLVAGQKLVSTTEDATAEEDEEEPIRNGNRRQKKMSLFFAPKTVAFEHKAGRE